MKATKAEVERRVNEVFRLIVEGASAAEIVRYATEEAGWGVQRRAVEHYVRRARARFVEIGERQKEEERGRALEQLDDLYREGRRAKDLRLCLAVRQELTEVLGLYPPKVTKNEHSGPDGGPIQIERVLSDGELHARLREELAGLEEGRALAAADPTSPAGD